jgi:hypothetical protein
MCATASHGQIENGDGQAAEKLLPLVYEELRKLAAAKMAQENPGQTLQATALVHEAYNTAMISRACCAFEGDQPSLQRAPVEAVSPNSCKDHAAYPGRRFARPG